MRKGRKGCKKRKLDEGVPHGQRGRPSAASIAQTTAPARQAQSAFRDGVARQQLDLDLRKAAIDDREKSLAKLQEEFEQTKREHAAQQAAATAKAKDIEQQLQERQQQLQQEQLQQKHQQQQEAAELAAEREKRKQAAAMHDQAAASARVERTKLATKRGAVLSEFQSRAILMLYFALIEDGETRESAVQRTASTFCIGRAKIYTIRTTWEDKEELKTTSGAGRGAVSAVNDGRLAFSPDQVAQL